MGIYQYLCRILGSILCHLEAKTIITERSELFRLATTKLHRAHWGDSWYRAGIAVVNEKGEFLLVEELRTRRNGVWYDSADMWNIASGSCKEDETFLAAAHREAHEELGRGIKLKGICDIKHGKHNDDPCLLITFLAELTDEIFEFDHKEIKSQRWFPKAEIYQLAKQDKLRSPDLVLRVVKNYQRGVILPLEVLNEYEAS